MIMHSLGVVAARLCNYEVVIIANFYISTYVQCIFRIMTCRYILDLLHKGGVRTNMYDTAQWIPNSISIAGAVPCWCSISTLIEIANSHTY